MFNKLKQPLQIKYNDGNTEKVVEPLINNSDPNLTFVNQAGGQLGTGTMIWISRLINVPRQTEVKTESGTTYKVMTSGQDLIAGLFYYQLEILTTKNGGEDIGEY
ncbi:hypothetical protein M8332_06875 (plasmid) [Fructilactobacillus ixorae]|uniref:Uncharacterized protein n=1 Tax=Fructilactobacillus ixorae TaxID=1750535 RepID=A0ABY5C7K2_9LACO|nr:hypothetical protein [Fructilactobacillus ixorae]USS94004.1 hypothetical protein M8332_06875 [Fructilactobacillus ixorae]